MGDYSSFEELHNNISHHRIVHIWWNPHLGVTSAKTVRLTVNYFWNTGEKWIIHNGGWTVSFSTLSLQGFSRWERGEGFSFFWIWRDGDASDDDSSQIKLWQASSSLTSSCLLSNTVPTEGQQQGCWEVQSQLRAREACISYMCVFMCECVCGDRVQVAWSADSRRSFGHFRGHVSPSGPVSGHYSSLPRAIR